MQYVDYLICSIHCNNHYHFPNQQKEGYCMPDFPKQLLGQGEVLE